MARTDAGWRPRPRPRRWAPSVGIRRLVTAAAATVAVAAGLLALSHPAAAVADDATTATAAGSTAAPQGATGATDGGGGGGGIGTAAAPRGVALVHMHDGAPFFLRLGALTLANKGRYAARHGYEMVAHVPGGTDGLFLPADCSAPGAVRRPDGACYTPFTDFAIDDRAATFGKIKLVLAACVSRPDWWLLWSDADALIINQSVPLPTIIDDAYHMAATEDWLMMNAGVLLFRCSPFTIDFLTRVYADLSFNTARALDQSALQHFLDSEPEAAAAMRWLPKHAMNVYTEEYRPGDFLVHMAGKLYEATTKGATAIARQFDLLSRAGDDIADVAAFFDTRYLAGGFSGLCPDEGNGSECPPEDERRIKLSEPLSAMTNTGRYKHVGLRYDWLEGWTDRHDPPAPIKVPFVPTVLGNVVRAVVAEPPTVFQPVDDQPVVETNVLQDGNLDGLPVVVLDGFEEMDGVGVQAGEGHDTSEL